MRRRRSRRRLIALRGRHDHQLLLLGIRIGGSPCGRRNAQKLLQAVDVHRHRPTCALLRQPRKLGQRVPKNLLLLLLRLLLLVPQNLVLEASSSPCCTTRGQAKSQSHVAAGIQSHGAEVTQITVVVVVIARAGVAGVGKGADPRGGWGRHRQQFVQEA